MNETLCKAESDLFYALKRIEKCGYEVSMTAKFHSCAGKTDCGILGRATDLYVTIHRKEHGYGIQAENRKMPPSHGREEH